ncbi:DNA-directed RNA polymerase III subunit RPC5 [[Candida] railenensis]|uniref:DNA-directed RNA polymerase III subunit RPC5 n=1 Tax=[Candida] railenensis TaxID=45579 RepID=A0A9P0QRR8_9ASCO|nr:DNA-directed RNA polymerase III subunit RPC5 [[Candida] railenensis]
MSLFVAEEDDHMNVDESPSSFHEALEEQPQHTSSSSTSSASSPDMDEQEDDDPIVSSIPLILSQVPNPSSQSLHLIQYPGRPKTLPYKDNLKPSIKEDSAFLEFKIPLDTSRFYDQSRSEDWGVSHQIEEHGLHGVLNKTEGGMYAGMVREDGKLILIPLDSTAQLRPSFKYLDDLEVARQAQRRNDFLEQSKPASVQVLQTSNAKSAAAQGNTGEGFANNALGESLRCIKKFDEERWTPLKFEDGEEAQKTRKELYTNVVETELKSKSTMSEYISELTKV